jgi:hypothetical protein
MTTYSRTEQFSNLIDKERGLIDRRLFSDPDIYQAELEQIFARCWNFVAHDSLIPNPGDFFMTFIGEDRVIVVRDNDMKPQVLINSCRHRGNAVCRADEGHATSFMCTYHGWTYDLQGRLVGVPGFKEVYHEELDRENWGLIKAAKVDSYGGLIFATMDPEATSLDEFLGEIGKLSIDYFNLPGRGKVVKGVQKWSVACNWKFAVDNVWDWYHVVLTHASSIMATGIQRRPIRPELVALGDYGHAIGGALRTPAEAGRRGPEVPEQDELGPVGSKMAGFGGIFPNLWLTREGLILRVPKGPMATEMWRLPMVNANPDDVDTDYLKRQIASQGPAGHFEVDDAENWGLSTSGTMSTVARRYPLHYGMGLGHGRVTLEEGGPPYVQSEHWTEHGARWHYANWAHWMDAASWRDIKEGRPPVPLETL